MRNHRVSRAWIACVCLAALLLPVAAVGNSGREFSGYFDISGVNEEGELLHVTLHLKLFNHNDADARSVIVALVDSSPSMCL